MLSPEEKSRKIRDLRSRIDAIMDRNRSNPQPNPGSAPPPSPDLQQIRRKLRSEEKTPAPRTSALQPIRLTRDIPRTKPALAVVTPALSSTVLLEESIAGEVRVHPRFGSAFISRIPLGTVSQRQEQLLALLSDSDSVLRQRLKQQCGIDDPAPSDLLFFDLETTGLGGSPLLLIGTMQWENGGFVVQQTLARTYAEEPAVIAQFLDLCATKRLLISFNGKSFDAPYVRMRAAANLIAASLPQAHLDLLHESRRRWKGVLPDCKLRTLERRICGRFRQGDIPGSEIPQAYHAFVRTGNAFEMVEILKHNHLDIVTMAELLVCMDEEPRWT